MMMMTPRPSSNMLSEVEDNGFFLSYEEEDDDNFYDGSSHTKAGRPKSQSIIGDEEFPPAEGEETNNNNKEEEEDENPGKPNSVVVVEVLPAKTFAPTDPLNARLHKLATDLPNHCFASMYYQHHDPHAFLFPPHHFAKQSTLQKEIQEQTMIAEKALEFEVNLEREETLQLERYRAGACPGRTHAADVVVSHTPKGKRSKSNTPNTSTALVPPAAAPPPSGTSSHPVHLLPLFEDRVRVLYLSTTGDSNCSHRTMDIVLESPVANNRRVHCQILEFGATLEDALWDALGRTSDAIVVNQPYSDHVNKHLVKTLQLSRSNVNSPLGVVVLTKLFGKTPVEAKKHAQRLGVVFAKKSEFDIELAARNFVLKMASFRGEDRLVIQAMEKQVKNLEKMSSHSGSCCIV